MQGVILTPSRLRTHSLSVLGFAVAQFLLSLFLALLLIKASLRETLGAVTGRGLVQAPARPTAVLGALCMLVRSWTVRWT